MHVVKLLCLTKCTIRSQWSLCCGF